MPAAVATSASAMPGATAWIEAVVAWVSPLNAMMMPTTVPNSPMNGDALAVEARYPRLLSSLVVSLMAALCIARWTASRLSLDCFCNSPLAARKMAVSGLAPKAVTFAYNSAQRELLSKGRRNSPLCRAARLVARAFTKIIAQEAMENKKRTTNTTLAMGLARRTKSRSVLLDLLV